MYQLHFDATVSKLPFTRTATLLRLTTGGPDEGRIPELHGFATVTADSGSACLHFYLATDELRALAAAMVEAADQAEKLKQHGSRETAGEPA